MNSVWPGRSRATSTGCGSLTLTTMSAPANTASASATIVAPCVGEVGVGDRGAGAGAGLDEHGVAAGSELAHARRGQPDAVLVDLDLCGNANDGHGRVIPSSVRLASGSAHVLWFQSCPTRSTTGSSDRSSGTDAPRSPRSPQRSASARMPSPSACGGSRRAGSIQGYTAHVDQSQLGRGLAAYIDVRLTPTTDPDAFERLDLALPATRSVAFVTGRFDYIVAARLQGRRGPRPHRPRAAQPRRRRRHGDPNRDARHRPDALIGSRTARIGLTSVACAVPSGCPSPPMRNAIHASIDRPRGAIVRTGREARVARPSAIHARRAKPAPEGQI